MVGCLRSAGTGQLVVPRVQTKHGEMAFSHCSAERANKKVSLHVKISLGYVAVPWDAHPSRNCLLHEVKNLNLVVNALRGL